MTMHVHAYLNEEIKHPRVDLILLVLAFASAIVDTVTVPTVRVFVANSTGNLLLLALGAAGLKKDYPTLVFSDRTAVALVSSWVAAFTVGYLGRFFGPRTRLWLVGEFTFEAALIFISAALLYTKSVSLENETNLVVITLLGWVFGAQAVVSKALGVKAILVPQVVTGAMGDLFSDPRLFGPLRSNVPRNQRAAFVIVFFAGAAIGGVALKDVNPEMVLILTAVFKLVAALLFFVVPGAKPKIVDEEVDAKPAISPDGQP